MNIRKVTPLFLLLALIAIGIYSCNHYYYVNHHFRKTYENVNEAIHNDTLNPPYFKIHFYNGDVSVLDDWELYADKDSLTGQGKLFDFNRNQIREGRLSFGVDEIAIIETNQQEVIRSKDSDRITALTILTIADAALTTACLINPKICFGSCPTFYIEGKQLLHSASAEGFSSSISPVLEKRDIDALQHSASPGVFPLTMKNEAYETHLINELRLEAVPKRKNEKVYQDKHGQYYLCDEVFPFTTCSNRGQETAMALNKLDDQEYFSSTDSFDLSAREEIILEFEDLKGKDIGIVLNYRQTLVTTFLLYSGLSYMGNEVGDYFTKIESSENLRDLFLNPFTRLGNLDLYAWDEERKKWQHVEWFYETGPIARNLIFAPIKGLQPRGGKLKIKVEMAKGLWRLDYVGLASINTVAAPVKVLPDKIEVVDGKKYAVEKVRRDDEDYLVSFPGNEYRFIFHLPELEDEKEYELFLASKGYYLEWMRQSWLKDKDPDKLRKLLLNNDRSWKELAEEFKLVEQELESVFWNSKYSKIQ